MTEPVSNLEHRLASLRPREVSADLEKQVAERIIATDEPHQTHWFFISTLASGAIAACLIVTMLLTPSAIHSPQTPSNLVQASGLEAGVGMTALARATWQWGDDLTFKDDRRFP